MMTTILSVVFAGMAIATAAKPKIAKTVKDELVSTASSVLTRIHDEMEQVFEAAEAILWQTEDERHIFDPSEVAIFRTAGYRTDSNGLLGLKGRAMTVKRLMRQAGTAAEFKAAQEAATRAASTLAEQVSDQSFIRAIGAVVNQYMAAGAPTAQEQAILDAHRKLAALLAARDETAERLAIMTAAREALRRRDNLPEFVNQRCDQLLFHSTADIRARLTDLKNELRRIDRVCEADPSSIDGSRAIVNYARRFPDELGVVTQRHGLDAVVGDQWRKHVPTLIERRKVVEAEIAELQPVIDRVTGECESDRDYWIRRLG